ncbi:NAD(P)/FAD-dependent oxidoreductase [Crocinitomicaceae bacterium]|nr:NAD(P)/FAD-dependent oxidoreductase [Crocinitomicaceae bacterium]
MKIGIVGMGPAGLMAGSQLAKAGNEIHLFDHKKAAGRKFLVAGNGGFNLTHSEEIISFIEKYDKALIQQAVKEFDNNDWRVFLEKEIKVPTFIGSSGKIFPEKGIKPITVLYNWLNYLTHYGATFHYEHSLLDFDSSSITIKYQGETIKQEFDYVIIALGGGSWRTTGSTAEWVDLLKSKKIDCVPLVASNSGFEINGWEKFKEIEGQTIKNVVVSHGEETKEGDIVISSYGLEGTPIYYMNRSFRNNPKEALKIDLKPTKAIEEIKTVLATSKNFTEGLRRLKLSKGTIQFLKLFLSKEVFTSMEDLANSIKNLQITPQSLRPIDEVISTVGGVSMNEINSNFELKKIKDVYICGEMLDWDAPTGGYLIQACVASGNKVAQSILSKTN